MWSCFIIDPISAVSCDTKFWREKTLANWFTVIICGYFGECPNPAKNLKRPRKIVSFHPTKTRLTKRFIVISLCNLSSHTFSLVTITRDYCFYIYTSSFASPSMEHVFSVETMVRGYYGTRRLGMHLLNVKLWRRGAWIVFIIPLR